MPRHLVLLSLLLWADPAPAQISYSRVDQGDQGFLSTSPWYVNLRNASGTEVGVVGAALVTSDTGGTTATYSAAVTGLVSAASATDIFCIVGSGTKTIRVLKMSIDGLAVTGGNITAQYFKRSAANTGGTSTTMTDGSLDSTNAAATATVRAYTANPSALGAGVLIESNRVYISGGATTASAEDVVTWGDYSQPLVLRGTSEQLCLNLNATSITSPTLNCTVRWTEL